MPRKKSLAIREPSPEEVVVEVAERSAGGTDDLFDQARETSKRVIQECVSYARSNPDRALLTALTAGYVLRMLPVPRMLAGIVRLALPLVKPAALLYAASKAAGPGGVLEEMKTATRR